VDGTPPDKSEDRDHDDLAALDFSPRQGESETVDLAVLGEYVAAEESDAVHDNGLADAFVQSADDEVMPLFSVTNPPGTVTVTTMMDGRVQQIDLSPKATTMTETHLAEEIVVVARLATQDARSAQYSFILEGMRAQGHDNVATRDFLRRDLDLPSPEDAEATRAEVFATRYAGGHD